MGYSQQHIQQTRQRILDCANRLFRKNGFANTSIDDLMAEANLTRGGFYAHFKSKADLFAHAMAQDINYTESLRAIYNDERMGVNKESVIESLKYYLSLSNLHKVGSACTMVTLAPEIARMNKDSRDNFTNSLSKLLDEFKLGLGDNEQAIRCLISAVGALTLARAVTNPELKKQLMQCGEDLAVEQASASN